MESCSSPGRPFHLIHFPAKEAVGRLNTQDCFLHRSRPIESGIASDTCIASGQSAAWLVLALSYMYGLIIAPVSPTAGTMHLQRVALHVSRPRSLGEHTRCYLAALPAWNAYYYTNRRLNGSRPLEPEKSGSAEQPFRRPCNSTFFSWMQSWRGYHALGSLDRVIELVIRRALNRSISSCILAEADGHVNSSHSSSCRTLSRAWYGGHMC